MRYSIDTSAILDGWNRYYPPDVFPGLWRRLEALIFDGALRATEEVQVELERKDDEVLAWANRQESLFVALDAAIQDSVRVILSDHPKLLDTRKNRSAADPFVIGLAQLHECSVVTGEGKTGSLSRPNIPDVCEAMGLHCLSLLELIRAEGWAFGD